MTTVQKAPATLFSFMDAAERLRLVPTATVPDIARGPEIPQEGYLVEEIADGVYLLGDGSYQMMFVVSNDGVIVVDAPPTLGHKILRAIASVTTKPITHIVYSHQHADHVGAMSILPAGCSALRAAGDRRAAGQAG